MGRKEGRRQKRGIGSGETVYFSLCSAAAEKGLGRMFGSGIRPFCLKHFFGL